jgi:trimethylamine:corrinoid methyltransferase-like protein
MMIDLEVVRRCWRLARGFNTASEEWLAEAISRVGPGGNFLSQRSTRTALRSGELYLSALGFHEPFEHWEAQGRPDILAEARDQIHRIIDAHQPLPFNDEVERELKKLRESAGQAK